MQQRLCLNLATSDSHSNPYGVYQKAQTTVKNSNLNPVWNEELKFSVPQHFGTLKLVSFDLFFSKWIIIIFSVYLILRVILFPRPCLFIKEEEGDYDKYTH